MKPLRKHVHSVIQHCKITQHHPIVGSGTSITNEPSRGKTDNVVSEGV